MMETLTVVFSVASLILNLLAFFWADIERFFSNRRPNLWSYTPSMVKNSENWIGVDDGDWTEWTCYEDGKVVRRNNITGVEVVVKLGAAT